VHFVIHTNRLKCANILKNQIHLYFHKTKVFVLNGKMTQTIYKSFYWAGLNLLSLKAINFFGSFILLLFLTPDDFGKVFIHLSIFGLLQLLRGFGLFDAIIKMPSISTKEINSIFWFIQILSLVSLPIFLSLYFFSDLFFQTTDSGIIILVIACSFLLNGLFLVSSSLMHRHKDFKTIFKINLIATIFSTILAIIMASFGYGFESILVKIVTQELFTALCYWYYFPIKIGIDFDFKDVKSLFGFSLPLLGTQATNYFARNFDDYAIGRFMGTDSLGIYNRVYNFTLLSFQNISGLFNTVLFPNYANAAKNELKYLYLQITKFSIFIYGFLSISIFLLSEKIIVGLLDVSWHQTIPLFKIFSIILFFQGISKNNSLFFKGLHRTKAEFYLSIVTKSLSLWLIIFGIFYYQDLTKISFLYLIGVVFSAVIQIYILCKYLDISFMEYNKYYLLLIPNVVLTGFLLYTLKNPTIVSTLSLTIYISSYMLFDRLYIFNLWEKFKKVIVKHE